MHTTVVQIIGARECPYTWRGRNLAEMRRVELYRLGRALDVGGPQSTKNDLLQALIGKLRIMDAETELSDMIGGADEQPV